MNVGETAWKRELRYERHRQLLQALESMTVRLRETLTFCWFGTTVYHVGTVLFRRDGKVDDLHASCWYRVEPLS
jgi:hypothetical protein